MLFYINYTEGKVTSVKWQIAIGGTAILSTLLGIGLAVFSWAGSPCHKRCVYRRKALKMERKKRFDAKKLNTRLACPPYHPGLKRGPSQGTLGRRALAVLIVAISLVLVGSGCGWQTTRSSQLKLQSIVDSHAQQIASNMIRMEEITQAVNDIAQNQTKLQEQIVAVQNDTDLLRENMITVLKQLKEQLAQIGSQISSAPMVQK
ncbi:MAG: hypothetical protein ACE5NM_09875 [Sedimentisphaerales bacterium]